MPCVCVGSEPVIIRNLSASLRAGPEASLDTSALPNGTAHSDHTQRRRTRVGVLISGTGISQSLLIMMYLRA